MRLKKPFIELLWAQEGVRVFEEIGFFMWAQDSVEEVLRDKTHYQLIRELGEGEEEQISVGPYGVALDTEVCEYKTFYKRGQWNPYESFRSTPDGETIFVLNLK